MADMQLCEACVMEYDWDGVETEGHYYCCAACSRGEECTCPQHNHLHHSAEIEQPLNSAAARQLGTP